MHQLFDKHVKNSWEKPRTVVTDFSTPLYDWKKYRPNMGSHSQHPTVYEMLRIKDDTVANVLFDVRRIEAILLLPDYNAGRENIERGSNDKCSEAFLKNGDKLTGWFTSNHLLNILKKYNCNYTT